MIKLRRHKNARRIGSHNKIIIRNNVFANSASDFPEADFASLQVT